MSFRFNFVWIRSEYPSGVDDYRHFRSTSGKTSSDSHVNKLATPMWFISFVITGAVMSHHCASHEKWYESQRSCLFIYIRVTGSFTGSGPEMTIIINSRRVFRVWISDRIQTKLNLNCIFQVVFTNRNLCYTVYSNLY